VVGEALVDYLSHGRPDTEDRHVFFRAAAPRRPIGAAAVSSIARRPCCRQAQTFHWSHRDRFAVGASSNPQPPPTGPWKLGCIARLCVEKGLDYLLAALLDLRECYAQVSLHIYGKGCDLSRLKDLARALRVADIVTLAGRFDPAAGPIRS
jgi:glycosyltransferase involved in cell wall biosynthesis